MKVKVHSDWGGNAAFNDQVCEVDEVKTWGVVVAMPVKKDGVEMGIAYARVANGKFTVINTN